MVHIEKVSSKVFHFQDSARYCNFMISVIGRGLKNAFEKIMRAERACLQSIFLIGSEEGRKTSKLRTLTNVPF